MKPRQLAADDNALIRAYLDDQLPNDLLLAFERRLLAEPELLEQVEIDQALRLTLREASWEGAWSPGSVGDEAIRSGGRRRNRHFWQRPSLAAAASLLLGAFFPGALWLQSAAETNQLRRTVSELQQPVGNVQVAVLDTPRSALPRVSIHIAEGASRVLLEVPVFPDFPQQAFRLTLTQENQPGAASITTDGLIADSSGRLTLLLGASQLVEGPHTMLLEQRQKNGEWTLYQRLNVDVHRSTDFAHTG